MDSSLFTIIITDQSKNVLPFQNIKKKKTDLPSTVSSMNN